MGHIPGCLYAFGLTAGLITLGLAVSIGDRRGAGAVACLLVIISCVYYLLCHEHSDTTP